MTTPHARAVIDLGALAGNVDFLTKKSGDAAVMAVVKADAYGHGLIPSARAALAGGATWLGTALYQEALTLRAAGISARVLTWLGTVDDQFAECIAADIDLGVSSKHTLLAVVQEARKQGKRARIHFKIDTGLGRNGATASELEQLIAIAGSEADAVNLVGAMSHFAYADEPNHPTIASQIANFEQAVSWISAAGFDLEVKHLANSAATLTLPEAHFNLVRPGIAIYGITPGLSLGTASELGLKPVLSLHASVALVKNVPAGSGVSYGHTYHTKAQTNLALISAGYSDGVPRAASNKAPVLLRGETFKVAGRVCMDQFVLDVGDLQVSIGDEALLFGDPRRGEPSVEDWAMATDTIGYEIVTRLGPRVERQYINVPD
ncbi:MAG: alanine racemase [Actinobacteria bacterium]|nr:alanine racemase [Actinomycetota bacterium]NBY15123.1 alanine racemase [Actinomycetota bacterium]